MASTTHEIIVRSSDTVGSGTRNKTIPASFQSTSISDKIENTFASTAGKVAGAFLLANIVNDAKSAVISLINYEISSIGTRTGGDTTQMHVNNVSNTIDTVKGMLSSPLSTLAGQYAKYRAFQLELSKNNDRADYYRKLYLQRTLQGGKKI